MDKKRVKELLENWSKMISEENVNVQSWDDKGINLEDKLDELFPKGGCKERGAALVLLAFFKVKEREFEKIIEIETQNMLTAYDMDHGDKTSITREWLEEGLDILKKKLCKSLRAGKIK